MERIKSNAHGAERKQGKRFRVLVVTSCSKRTMLHLHEQYGENWAESYFSSLIGPWEFLEAVVSVWPTTVPCWTQGWVSWRARALQTSLSAGLLRQEGLAMAPSATPEGQRELGSCPTVRPLPR